jgi:hypothetical protein
VTALLGLLVSLRVQHLGDWFPNVPMQLGVWRGHDLPRDVTVSDGSHYLARVYGNPLGEGVELFLVAPRSIDSYRDPRGCLRGSGYSVTAERDVTIDGTRVKMMVLRSGDIRQIMCYWIQERGGGTRPEAPAFAYSRLARAVQTLRFAGAALVAPRPVCLVRVFAPIPPSDPRGQQTRRNVLELADRIHNALKQ